MTERPRNARPRFLYALLVSILFLVIAGGVWLWRLQHISTQVRNVGGRFDSSSRQSFGQELMLRIRGESAERRHWINFHDSALDDEWLRRNGHRLASLSNLKLFVNERVTDDGLQHLRGLDNITMLVLNSVPVTNASVDQILTLRRIRGLNIAQTRITADQLPRLCQLIDLQHLSVDDTHMTKESIGGLMRSPRLSGINVCDATDHTVVLLKDQIKLRELMLRGPGVTDASVPVLSEMDHIEWLTLRATSISEQGLETLTQALPNCQIEVRKGKLLYDLPSPRRAPSQLE